MTVEVSEITLEEQDEILNEQEGHCFELKSVDISPAKLTETLSAFANTTGACKFFSDARFSSPQEKTAM